MGCLAVLQPGLPLVGITVAVELQVDDAEGRLVLLRGRPGESCGTGRLITQGVQVVKKSLVYFFFG